MSFPKILSVSSYFAALGRIGPNSAHGLVRFMLRCLPSRIGDSRALSCVTGLFRYAGGASFRTLRGRKRPSGAGSDDCRPIVVHGGQIGLAGQIVGKHHSPFPVHVGLDDQIDPDPRRFRPASLALELYAIADARLGADVIEAQGSEVAGLEFVFRYAERSGRSGGQLRLDQVVIQFRLRRFSLRRTGRASSRLRLLCRDSGNRRI